MAYDYTKTDARACLHPPGRIPMGKRAPIIPTPGVENPICGRAETPVTNTGLRNGTRHPQFTEPSQPFDTTVNKHHVMATGGVPGNG